MSEREIRIGISTCLIGEKVRFDGGHKRDGLIMGTLSPLVSFVPVCPEVDVGMGVPREAVRLIRSDDEVRMVGHRSGRDWTRAMQSYARTKIKELESLDLCGFILKKNSPTCGMERVRVYEASGNPTRKGRGLFAEVLLARSPLLPVEEEGRLQDPRLRENFFERVFAYMRLQELFRGRWTPGKLVDFHTREKLLLLAHDPVRYRQLGRLVAGAKARKRAEVAAEYREGFMGALTRIATTKKHRNVLDHARGYFKKFLSPDEKAELGTLIDDFAQGLVPLVAPITLIRHYVRRHGVEYLEGQTYLEPHPKELMLRNHV